MKKITAILLVFALVFSLAGCFSIKGESDPLVHNRNGDKDFVDEGNGYSVSSSNKLATEIGAKILEEGGNAVDAAIATAYALAVVEPYASGLGGSGGMVIYDPFKDEYKFINYMSAAAPSGTTYASICIPGFVSGMETAREMYGTMGYDELLEPAIEYAEKGFEISRILQERISTLIPTFAQPPASFLNTYEGGTLVQQDLADILRIIVKNGANDFYTGEIADMIVSATGFTSEDLAAYKAIVQTPAMGKFGDYTVASGSAPFSGTMLISMLEMMDMLNTPDPDDDPGQYLRDMITIKTLATSDRNRYLCDTRFNDRGYEYDTHTSREYLADLLGKDISEFADDDESEDTTHFSIVDKDGMVVSCTNTLAAFFGAKKYVSGIFMNNAMRNFTTGINAYAPGKRPRTYIAPVIAKSGDNVIAGGAPGGKVIPFEVCSVVADILRFGSDPNAAVRKQRIFVTNPYSIIMEIGLDEYGRVVNPVGHGYSITPYGANQWFGSVNIAGYSDKNNFYAAPDVRRDGYGLVCRTDK